MKSILKKKLKNLFLSVVVIIPVIAFSQKDSVEKDSISDLLIGKWTWEYSYGGWAGITITPETAGYDRTLLFEDDTLNSDSLFYYTFINDSIIEFGKTKIRKDSSVYPDTILYFYRIYEDLLNIEDDLIYDVSFDQDTLNLFEYCVDCYQHYFKKDTTLSITRHYRIENIIRVHVFPNPVKQFLYIQRNGKNPCELFVKIFNPSGQLLMKYNLNHDIKQIDLSEFTKGMYFLRIESKEFSKTEKIIIL